MEPLRLLVRPRAKGFVAESIAPDLTALGSSSEEAAENARRMALAGFAMGPRPATLIVRSVERGRSTIRTQLLDEPIGAPREAAHVS